MKTLFLFSIAFMSLVTASNTFAQNRHCRHQDNQCEQNFRRADIYKELLSVEGGDVSDTQIGLATIEELSRRLNVRLSSAAANYIYLLNQHGGRSTTQVTRQTIQTLSSYVDRRNQLADVVDFYLKIYTAEGADVNDSLRDLSTARKVAKATQLSFSESVSLFIELLDFHGGRSTTQITQSTLESLISLSRNFSIDDIYRAYTTLYRAEGADLNDALSDLHLVVKAGDVCGSIREALEEFLSLLNSLGGRSTTQTTQQAYRNLFGI